MSDFRELYQEMILDHARRPRNHEEIEGARRAEGYNPLCGDRLTVYVDEDAGVIRRVGFRGQGCAISQASASIMTEVLEGKSAEAAEELFEAFHDVVMGAAEPDLDQLGKLAAFAGVRDYPSRVKCASLAWHAFRNALHERPDVARTEGGDDDPGESAVSAGATTETT